MNFQDFRKDLFEGKYKPDMKQLEEFYRVTRKSCRLFTKEEHFLRILDDLFGLHHKMSFPMSKN